MLFLGSGSQKSPVTLVGIKNRILSRYFGNFVFRTEPSKSVRIRIRRAAHGNSEGVFCAVYDSLSGDFWWVVKSVLNQFQVE